MPSPKRHRKQAKRNQDFYDKIRAQGKDDQDWAHTALFYSAVHETQAFLESKASFLATKGKPVPRSHGERSAVLGAHWKRLGIMYDKFLSLNKQFRYDCIEPTEQDLKDAEDLLQRMRDQIKAYR
jgi:hypothetical protein